MEMARLPIDKILLGQVTHTRRDLIAKRCNRHAPVVLDALGRAGPRSQKVDLAISPPPNPWQFYSLIHEMVRTLHHDTTQEDASKMERKLMVVRELLT